MAFDKIKNLESRLEGLRKKPNTAAVIKTRTNLLNDLAKEYLLSNPNQCEKYARQAMALAKSVDYKVGIARSHLIIGTAHLQRGAHDKALEWSSKALEIAKGIEQDKAMADALNAIAVAHYNMGHFDQALVHNRKALSIRRSIKDRQGIAFSLNNIGNVYGAQGQYTKALGYYQEALSVFENIRDTHHAAIAYGNIGHTYSLLCNYDKALENCLASLKLLMKVGDRLLIGTCYNDMGLIYHARAESAKALEHHQKALTEWESIGNNYGCAIALGNIGNVHNFQHSYVEAVDCYCKSLKIFEHAGNRHRVAQLHVTIARTLLNQGKHDEALEHSLKATDLLENLGDKLTCSHSHITIGEIYEKKSEYQRALDHYLKSLKHREEIGYKEGVAETCAAIANVQIKLKQWDAANAYVKKGLQVAEEIGSKRMQKYGYEIFSRLCEAQQDYRQSLDYFKKYAALNEEIYNAEKSKQITEIRTKYETEKKEKEAEVYHLKNLKLRKEIKERKRLERELKRHRDDLEELVKERTAQLRSLAHELSLVEEQQRRKIATYLHDEVSQKIALAAFKLDALEKIKSIVHVKEEQQGIKRILDEAAQLTRSLTFEISPPVLYEFGLEAAIEWLVRQFSKNHRIQCRFKDDGKTKLLADDTRILLFQSVRELLTNIGKHASAKMVTVSTARDDNVIRITVRDDGVGFDPSILYEKIARNEGFGLFNVRERLKHLKGELNIDSKKGHGTAITIIAPLGNTQ